MRAMRVTRMTGQNKETKEKDEEEKEENKEEKENCCGRAGRVDGSNALQEVLADLKMAIKAYYVVCTCIFEEMFLQE